MNAAAYIRVSTSAQDMDNQRHELTEFAASLGMTISRWIEADGVSSRRSYADRRIDDVLRLRKGETLLVTELSRLARSTRQVLEVVEELGKRGVVTLVKKQGLRLNGADDVATKAVVTSLGLAADIERTMISDRTRSALARRKAEGQRLGMANKTPEFVAVTQAKGTEANRRRAAERTGNVEELLRSFKARGLSERGMVEELNRIGMPSPRGGNWSQATVNRMCRRIGLHHA
ncbi:Serine recombinase PinR [Fundidesulfovibrio magnetotacticus]|uniref:Serine recombinase PinR n=1 Tax=Fundidesulfovibrio magnetotacticus TaxID=2730080 RepID=A0A6V8LXD2_9BACT|nr:recombinase family protein [Fundidesulfovibrio magnetotacticus]GFK94729.1 Serine recombinase PinR [Fundidesulfovibrio magnetotacticus]